MATFTTTDLGIAAYYMVNGLELVGIERDPNIRNTLDCVFCFRDDDDLAAELLLRWTNSKEQRFDEQMRALRKLVAQVRRSNRRRYGTVKNEGKRHERP
jgi:hypothetical protein